jgi:integrase
MHLLEAGVNLIYIRDILGHASVTTTEIYAKTNPEIKRKYLTEHSTSYTIGEKYTTEEKDGLLKWLKESF